MKYIKEIKIFPVICCLFAAIAATFAFPNEAVTYESLKTTQRIFGGDTASVTALGILFSIFFYYVYNRVKKRFLLPALIISVLFAIVNTVGMSFYFYDDFTLITASLFNFLLSMITMVGQGILCYAALVLCYELLENGTSIRFKQKKKYKIIELFEKKTVLVSFIAIFVCWIPWLLIFYPASITNDCVVQIAQFYGFLPLDNAHPIFSTLLVGSFVKLGDLLGSQNLGMFLYILLQSAVCAYAFALIINCIRDLKTPPLFQYFTLAFYCIVPIWGGYAQCAIKDTLFTGAMTLFCLQTVKSVIDSEKMLNSKKEILIFTLSALFACLLRHNGLFLVLPVVIFLGIFVFAKKQRIMIGIPLLLACAVYLCINEFIVPIAGIGEQSKREIYSLPFQQTARYVKEHGDEVTDMERRAIDAVLDYDNLAELYNSQCSDDVKRTYKLDGNENEDELLENYFTVWKEMMIKHPHTYVEAFVSLNYGYYSLTPQIKGEDSTGGKKIRTYMSSNLEKFDFEISRSDSVVTEAMKYLSALLLDLPILGLLCRNALYFWILITLSVLFIHKKRYSYLIALLPLLILAFGCAGSPINDETRYFLPIISTTPVLLGLAYNMR